MIFFAILLALYSDQTSDGSLAAAAFAMLFVRLLVVEIENLL